MSIGGDTPQPATAPTASAVDAPVSGTSGGTLDPGVLEALRAAVRQEVRAALAPAPSSSNPPTSDSTTPAAPGTASGKNSARGSSDTYVRGKAPLRDGRAKPTAAPILRGRIKGAARYVLSVQHVTSKDSSVCLSDLYSIVI